MTVSRRHALVRAVAAVAGALTLMTSPVHAQSGTPVKLFADHQGEWVQAAVVSTQ